MAKFIYIMNYTTIVFEVYNYLQYKEGAKLILCKGITLNLTLHVVLNIEAVVYIFTSLL